MAEKTPNSHTLVQLAEDWSLVLVWATTPAVLSPGTMPEVWRRKTMKFR